MPQNLSDHHPLSSFPSVTNLDDAGAILTDTGKIVGVSVYPTCAEVTRVLRFSGKSGRNIVRINELPWALDPESLRVHAKGSAVVHAVHVEKIHGYKPPKSAQLIAIQHRKSQLEKQLSRLKITAATLDTYSGTLNYDNVTPAKIEDVLNRIREVGDRFDDEILKLEEQLRVTDDELEAETEKHEARFSTNQIPFQASIILLTKNEGAVELFTTYTVGHAQWTPTYDLHVKLQDASPDVVLTYKAIIKQETGESWINVPLTLRTSPSAEVELPALHGWALSLDMPPLSPLPVSRKRRRESTGTPARKSGSYAKRNANYEEESEEDEEENEGEEDAEDAAIVDEETGTEEVEQAGPSVEAAVETQDQPNATFKIPNTVTIISDGSVHQALIAEMRLDAELTWISVPKSDRRVHLKARLRNTSEYTLLANKANVYVDRDLVSQSDIPAVVPTESFDCSLGFDPSIRVTYHPAVKNVSTTGFYNKSRSYSHVQRITIHNTKHLPVKNFQIIDNIPVSEDAQVAVKLISPPLKLPSPGVEFGKEKGGFVVRVAEGIVAQWGAGSGESAAVDASSLGKDGQLFWLCEIPAQQMVSLVLQWEVLAPPGAQVVGL